MKNSSSVEGHERLRRCCETLPPPEKMSAVEK
jgi:hypothetical protein